ncbi:MAG: hypothetical protein H6525_10790 [Actinobacteria bacterium]|nr:hypothetical protein [Actinomycetota bacterium]MCB9413310.1 hypothetical protein [Actinomycetota bacterium]
MIIKYPHEPEKNQWSTPRLTVLGAGAGVAGGKVFDKDETDFIPNGPS